MFRSKRDAGDINSSSSSSSSSTPSRRDRGFVGRRTKTGAHFYSYINEDLLARQRLDGIETIGGFTRNGFVSKDKLFNFWKAEDWVDTDVFQYNAEDGKVTVKKRGLYLVYAQVMFHGSSARKSFGIYLNDDIVPVVESLSFNVLPVERRGKRGVESHHIPEYVTYNQCNTQGVLYIKKNDKLCIQSMDLDRAVITQRPLTFFGLAKL